MEKLKNAYYYLFYKIYKFSEAAPAKWGSDWKAGISIIALEIWFLLALICYYNVLVDRYFQLRKSHFIIAGMIIIVSNYFAFFYTDVWKDYVKKFDALPKKINRIGSWIVFGIVILVIVNLVFAFYLMSQVNWSLYK